jgi:hypothetical protein
VRVSKEFGFGGGDRGIELIGEIFNLLNSKNPAGFNGSVTNANFGQPSVYAGDAGQGEQRLAQLGLRLRF